MQHSGGPTMPVSAVNTSLDLVRVAARTESKNPSIDVSSTAKITTEYAAPLRQAAENDNRVTLSAQASAAPSEPETANNDSVKVSSSIGRAASAGQLSRDEAVAIYQKIANLL
ncbi:hypothetical protein EOE67_19780 [Rheinheimera riviphila]|uniref:Uncharacterized protein n=1 Tax=Rheinheimera riviphila TaxID=1834037 RepID=A0A437QBH3_9GAMM|nr:hypothetical protein [Rheinheimera riviphila]RVU31876.1 hypothetical protein EOE67_19780 [Rheinheimera riviphila]